MHLDGSIDYFSLFFLFLIGGNGKKKKKAENAPYPLCYEPVLFIIIIIIVPWEISLGFLFREKKNKKWSSS